MLKINDIATSKRGKAKTLYVVLSVYRNGRSLTLSNGNRNRRWRFKKTLNEKGLAEFGAKITGLFEELLEGGNQQP